MYRSPGFYENLYKFVDLKMLSLSYTVKDLYLYKRFDLKSNIVYLVIPWKFFEEELDLEYDP